MYDYKAFWFIFDALYYDNVTFAIGITDAVLLYLSIIAFITGINTCNAL